MQKKQVLSMMMATFSGRHKCFHNGIILIVNCFKFNGKFINYF